jgi:hypothetical protein
MSAIAAVSRTVKTMSDGTLRLTVDIEPMHANDAFALFGAGNVPMALAALVTGTAIPDKEPEPEVKGGALARLAGMIVNNPDYWDMQGIGSSGEADQIVKGWCRIKSKRELDHNEEAAELFHRHVRKPFLAWQEARR